MIIPFARRVTVPAVAVLASIGGAIVALHYHRLGLTLSHYDARGHLVVARRIVDSITPGWQQIGAVWLPLPHLLNAIPVQVDSWYRSGASAVAISIVAFAIAAGAIAWIVDALNGSSGAAIAGAAVLAFNPNVLYLQSTPMTEPLLLALILVAVALLFQWCGRGLAPAALASATALSQERRGWGPGAVKKVGPSERREMTAVAAIGSAFALACLTRYEAWPVTASALVAALWARWRGGEASSVACRKLGRIAAYPATAILGFAVFSRVVTGRWFVASNFFVPENKALGDPLMAAAEISWGTHMLSGSLVMMFAAIGLAALLGLSLISRRWAVALVVLSLGTTAAVPWAAFVDGHPFRIRYMVPLIAVEAVGAGVAAGLVRRARGVAVTLLLAAIAFELHPLDVNAPMIVEAQWDRPNVPVRNTVTECLRARAPGEKIMASMGSLGHYMQETARAGLGIDDFLHEGNGDIWLTALQEGPRAFAAWVLIEEKAEGGDMLAHIARENPRFLGGYTRVCEGAGLALYRRKSSTTEVTEVNSGHRPTK